MQETLNDDELIKLLQSITQENKLSDYSKILHKIQKRQLEIYLQRVILEELVIQRSLIQQVVDHYDDLEVLLQVLALLQDKQLAFEVQISTILVKIANIYEEQGEYSTAATYLSRIPLDSGTRVIQDDYKLEIYVRIVRLYLEDEDFVNADAYLNRAAMLVPKDKKMALQLVACQARSLDFKRQFVQSALKYLELSFEQEMHDSERIEAFVKAIVCAILAGAGPQRSRLLATLYRDERVRDREEVKRDGVAAILEKMFTGSLVKKQEVQEFSSILSPHHLALLPDGSTVFDRAVMEHNLLVASKLYLNISFSQLGELLGISTERAEEVASGMIQEKRLDASIDQIDNLIIFKTFNLSGWDESIGALCRELDVVVEKISTRHPAFVKQFGKEI